MMEYNYNTPQKTLISLQGWIQIAIVGILFMSLHYYVLNILWRTGMTDSAWSHIFLIPFISIYLIYKRKEALKRQLAYRDWKGLILFIFGLTMYAGGTQLNSTMVMGYATVLELLGLVWFFVGSSMIKLLFIPILYLGFAVKFSYLYTYISMFLKKTAATIGALVVNVTGLPWDIEADSLGAVLNIYHQGLMIQPPLNVAEACSGMRSLMAITAISVALAFLDWRPWYSRACIIIAALPLAIASNVVRLSITGLLYPFNPELAHGDPHQMTGMLTLIPALLLLLGITKLCDQLWKSKPFNKIT